MTAAPVGDKPFYREAGIGDGVVCLHSNASTSGQWRGLMELLARTHHVFAVDSYGAGQSADWPSDREITLADEARFIEPVLARAGEPLVLVGHSYGAAVALIAALRNPKRVKAMALYEPTLFSLIDAESPAPNDADGIRNAVASAVAHLEAGSAEAAARCFIDYWMGEGSWAAMPPARKPAVAASVRNIRRWGHALTREPAKLQAFAALDMPVLYMTGQRSTQSALGVARLLAPVLPRAELESLEGLGHMGPVTHPDRVNATIAAFLARL